MKMYRNFLVFLFFVPMMSCRGDLEDYCVPLQDLCDTFIYHLESRRCYKGFSLIMLGIMCTHLEGSVSYPE